MLAALTKYLQKLFQPFCFEDTNKKGNGMKENIIPNGFSSRKGQNQHNSATARGFYFIKDKMKK